MHDLAIMTIINLMMLCSHTPRSRKILNSMVRWSLIGLKLLALSDIPSIWRRGYSGFSSIAIISTIYTVGASLIHSHLQVTRKWQSTDSMTLCSLPLICILMLL